MEATLPNISLQTDTNSRQKYCLTLALGRRQYFRQVRRKRQCGGAALDH